MKKKLKKIYVVVLIALSINVILNVRADSGWDSSYDGGSDWSSSSSSSDWSSSSSSSSNINRSLPSGKIPVNAKFIPFAIALLCFSVITKIIFSKNKIIWIIALILSIAVFCIAVPPIIPFVLIMFVMLVKQGAFDKELFVKNYDEISSEEIQKIIDVGSNELKKEFYNKFVDIQNAWMNFDYDKLRKLCSDEIYNTYYEELEALKLKDGQNVMSNFKLLSDKIIDIKEDHGIVTVSYYLEIRFYDYVINKLDGKVTKGNKYSTVHNKYILKFTMSKNNILDRCPNCNAPLELSENSTCVYCNSTVIKSTNDFVMISKRRV